MMLKIVFDKVVSLVGLIILSPVLLIVALLIKWKMPGPILFCQQRVGRYGRIFTVYKFRTMTVKAEASVASRNSEATSIASQEQSRITPLGEKLRRYKLDELPELWNVLKGDMSFVGPRPDVPGYADQLQGEDREVLLLRPGITGPASLKYRNEEDILEAVDEALQKGRSGLPIGITTVQEYNDNVIYPDKVRLNRYYLHHYSFIKDIQMIVCTVLGKRMEYAGEQI
ncbi:sugar transferase [Segatella oris]|uniref:Colanic biosynthesis UDP-glucose lipid carrier transferase n=1 Tax=Segatella oris TaxID=28135 RepID=A0A448L7H0_9BACT|nr:sugar transferase [Segatella oris]OFP29014.1 sugar transferase [Prevotella sp. HMSC069G02]VEH15938.1 Putative colanic biosynthesis UDP-glucose lipid carrier transferase [Segatella oris]